MAYLLRGLQAGPREQFQGMPVGLWGRWVIVIVMVTLVCWLDRTEGMMPGELAYDLWVCLEEMNSKSVTE